MTRKDYILIAEALRAIYLEAKKTSKDSDNQVARLSGVQEAATEVAEALQRDNPSFNLYHFLAVVRGEKDLNSKPSRNKAQS